MIGDTPPVATRHNRIPAGGSFVLALMRIAIGWHFLYEGTVKLLDRDWSAGDYLRGSVGPLSGVFHRIAESPWLLSAVDYINVGALVVIVAALMLGLFIRTAAIGGVLLLAMYYLAYPPFFGGGAGGAAEGHYLLVNKNLVEMIALLVVLAMPVAHLGLDGILAERRRRRKTTPEAAPLALRDNEIVMNLAPADFSRRSVLAGLAGTPFVGGYVLAALKQHGWTCHEERHLAGQAKVDARSGATRKFDLSSNLADLKGRLPKARIGDVELSRMLMGGNLIGGWAHARDLIYVSKLIRAYHHRQKIWETLRLAEAAGINTILTNPHLCDIINDYWKNAGGKIQFISDCGEISGDDNAFDLVKKSIDNGACACYVQGAMADEMVADGRIDEVGECVGLIRESGVPAGIGAHHLSTIQACVKAGFKPDFWVKTLHHTNYWSATKKDEHDNVWCDNPEETIAYMRELPQPWIGFKVLAAGAIEPKEGFRYAFANGADFICVGMYDFQIIEDVNIALEVLAEKDKLGRQRAWCAV